MTTGAHGVDTLRSIVSMVNEVSAGASRAMRTDAAVVIEKKDHRSRSRPSISPVGGGWMEMTSVVQSRNSARVYRSLSCESWSPRRSRMSRALWS